MTIAPWDPYDVWHRLLHQHPVAVANPAGSAGRMDTDNAGDFWMTIADYPDPLQDTLYVIAHAEGFEAAIAALDSAVADHMRSRRQTIGQDQSTRIPARRRATHDETSAPRRYTVAT